LPNYVRPVDPNYLVAQMSQLQLQSQGQTAAAPLIAGQLAAAGGLPAE